MDKTLNYIIVMGIYIIIGILVILQIESITEQQLEWYIHIPLFIIVFSILDWMVTLRKDML